MKTNKDFVRLLEVELINFQKHKHLVVQFAPDFTVIKGENEAGKSAIRRSISWVLQDYPRGNVITLGEKQCTVNITLLKNDKPRIISRTRTTGGTNFWTIDNVKIDKPGGLPPEIIDIFPSPEITIDTDRFNLCIAKQSDGYFLIDAGPTVRAKLIDKLTGIDIVDVAIKQVNNQIKTLTKAKEVEQVKFDVIKDKVKQSSSLLKISSAIANFATNIVGLKQRQAHIEAIENSTQKANTANTALAQFNVMLQTIPENRRAVEDKSELLNKLKAIIQARQKIQQLQNRLDQLPTNINSPKISVTEQTPKLKKLALLDKLITRIMNLQQQKQETETVFSKAVQEQSVIKHELSKIKMCPTCKRPWGLKND